MMFLPFSLPPSTSLIPVFLLHLLLLPPSLISSSFSHPPLSWTSPHEPCYHLGGRPRHCLSEFINAAYGVPVNASHSLRGADSEGNITTLTDLNNPHNLTCWRAHAGADRGDWVLTLPLGRRFEITYISLQFCSQGEPTDPISISILKSMDYGRTWRPMQHYSSDCLGNFGQPPRTIAQTRHQETEPLCSDPRPLQRQRGGMVLAFSALDGRPSSPDFDYSPTLQDWVTATDIRVIFHQVSNDVGSFDKMKDAHWLDGPHDARETGFLKWGSEIKGHAGDRVDKLNRDNTLAFFDSEIKVERVDKQRRKNHRKGSSQDEDGHNVTSKEEEGSFGMDLVALSKKGGKSRGRGRNKENSYWAPCPNGDCNWTVEGRSRSNKGRELRKRRNNNVNARQSVGNLQVAQPSAFVFPVRAPVAVSDLQVGGRCKCNGHASRCRRDDAGRAVCMCEHHTAGPDCDVCEDFHFDRPWHRATPTHPNPCVACECNGHSNKCRFSMEVFQQSGRRSGGVCLKCRHHTAGRHCQYCQNGYTRDHSKPLTHRKACQPCQCHPLGAVGRWCNQTSGQCLCRDGVTGPRCNRCAPGYKQGNSPLRPCVRIQEVAPTPVYQPQYSIGSGHLSGHATAEECVSYCQPSQVKVTMNLETYCLKDYVLKVQVKGTERSGPWWQFSISIQTVFRTGSNSRVRRGPQSLWVPDLDLSCGCPALHVGRTFLLIGAEEGERSWGPEESRLVADRSTLALQWREHWSSKLRGFRGQDKRGRCPQKSPNNHHRGREHTKTQSGYIPPHLLAEKDSSRHGGDKQPMKVEETQTSAPPPKLSLHNKSTQTPPPSSAPVLMCSTPGPE